MDLHTRRTPWCCHEGKYITRREVFGEYKCHEQPGNHPRVFPTTPGVVRFQEGNNVIHTLKTLGLTPPRVGLCAPIGLQLANDFGASPVGTKFGDPAEVLKTLWYILIGSYWLSPSETMHYYCYCITNLSKMCLRRDT